MKKLFKQCLLILGAVLATQSHAEDVKTITLVCKDGVFTPETIEGPANAKFKLVVKNEGKTAEEFESDELQREKVIQAGKSVTIQLGPLPAGTYSFIGEFHPATAKGKLTLK
jgi:hypothetical protein